VYLSKKKERQLEKMYPNTDDKDIARILGISEWLVRKKAAELELEKETSEGLSATQIDFLVNHYSFHDNAVVAERLGISKAEVEHQAFRMGLQKNENFFRNILITYEEEQLVKQWNNEYTKAEHGSSKGNYVLGKILHHIYPNYTLTPELPMGGLFIDWFIKELKIGFEVQGSQHEEFNNFHYETKYDFIKAQSRDYDKSFMCEKSGIGIVYLYHDEKLSIPLIKAKVAEII
jgi:hypothetical protein